MYCIRGQRHVFLNVSTVSTIEATYKTIWSRCVIRWKITNCWPYFLYNSKAAWSFSSCEVTIWFCTWNLAIKFFLWYLDYWWKKDVLASPFWRMRTQEHSCATMRSRDAISRQRSLSFRWSQSSPMVSSNFKPMKKFLSHLQLQLGVGDLLASLC